MQVGSTIYILGSGGFAQEVRDYYLKLSDSTWKIFLVDDRGGDISVKEYHKAINTRQPGTHYTILGSGKTAIKKNMLAESKPPYASFLHPWARIITNIPIGHGSIIAPGAVIAPRVKIGKHVLVNYNATVGHDSIVGDLCVISPNAAVGGNCILEDGVYVGSGATIRENVTVGAGATIGMGSVVLNDVPPGITVIGVPAKEMKL